MDFQYRDFAKKVVITRLRTGDILRRQGPIPCPRDPDYRQWPLIICSWRAQWYRKFVMHTTYWTHWGLCLRRSSRSSFWMSVWSWILSFGMNSCFIQFLISISSQLMQFQIELYPRIQSKLSIYSLIMNSFESTLIAYEGWYVLKEVCCRKTNPI